MPSLESVRRRQRAALVIEAARNLPAQLQARVDREVRDNAPGLLEFMRKTDAVLLRFQVKEPGGPRVVLSPNIIMQAQEGEA